MTCAAWIGNRDYSSTSSYLTANSLWHEFMSLALEDVKVTPFPTVDNPKYTSQPGYSISASSSSSSSNYDEIKGELSGYEAGSLTEDGLTALYPAYEVHVTYQYSKEYDEGVVMSVSFDSTNGVINAVVSQGPKP